MAYNVLIRCSWCDHVIAAVVVNATAKTADTAAVAVEIVKHDRSKEHNDTVARLAGKHERIVRSPYATPPREGA